MVKSWKEKGRGRGEIRGKEEAPLREPKKILDEIVMLDEESAKLMNNLKLIIDK